MQKNKTTQTLLDTSEPARAAYVMEHGILLATGECGIRWYGVAGVVWCVRSATQCHYCAEAHEWTMPQHATCAHCDGSGQFYNAGTAMRCQVCNAHDAA